MPDPLTFSAFTTRDVANLALQRTGALLSIPRLGRYSYLAWRRGRDWPLLLESWLRRPRILRYCEKLICDDYAQLEEHLSGLEVERLTDIGCGYGLIDVWLYRLYRCHLQLIDVERTELRDHNFGSTGAGYAALSVARRFLEDNGVPSDRISTCNPTRQELPRGPVDLIVSLLSVAFHFPLDQYAAFIAATLRPGGHLVLDVRRTAKQDLMLLGGFAERIVVKTTAKYDRLLLRGFLGVAGFPLTTGSLEAK